MNWFAWLLPAACLLAGCATLAVHFEPNADLSQLKYVYVVESLNDNHSLAAMIVRDLRARGIQADNGPLTLIPSSAKAYLTYADRWEWDFRDYLIALSITVRAAGSDRLLAAASYSRPTAFLKTPPYMVQTALDGLFQPGTKSSQPSVASPAPTEEAGRRGGRRD
jgi:hypothetical protein